MTTIHTGAADLTQQAIDTMYWFAARAIVRIHRNERLSIAERYQQTQDMVVQIHEEMGDRFQPSVLGAWIQDVEAGEV